MAPVKKTKSAKNVNFVAFAVLVLTFVYMIEAAEGEFINWPVEKSINKHKIVWCIFI